MAQPLHLDVEEVCSDILHGNLEAPRHRLGPGRGHFARKRRVPTRILRTPGFRVKSRGRSPPRSGLPPGGAPVALAPAPFGEWAFRKIRWPDTSRETFAQFTKLRRHFFRCFETFRRARGAFWPTSTLRVKLSRVFQIPSLRKLGLCTRHLTPTERFVENPRCFGILPRISRGAADRPFECTTSE